MCNKIVKMYDQNNKIKRYTIQTSKNEIFCKILKTGIFLYFFLEKLKKTSISKNNHSSITNLNDVMSVIIQKTILAMNLRYVFIKYQDVKSLNRMCIRYKMNKLTLSN